MKKVVKSIKYNWHQVGSLLERGGVGEDWTRFTLGENNVTSIEEQEPVGDGDRWSYVIYVDDKMKFRIFNPNFVEYDSQ